MSNYKKSCLICCKKISAKYLRSHLCEHFDYRPYCCEHTGCGVPFSDERQIDFHSATKHGDIKRMNVISNGKIELVLSWIMDNYDYLSSTNNNHTNLSQLIRHKMTQVLAKLHTSVSRSASNDQLTVITPDTKPIPSYQYQSVTNNSHHFQRKLVVAKKSIYNSDKWMSTFVDKKRSTLDDADANESSSTFDFIDKSSRHDSNVATSSLISSVADVDESWSTLVETDANESSTFNFVDKNRPKFVDKNSRRKVCNVVTSKSISSMPAVNKRRPMVVARRRPTIAAPTATATAIVQRGEIVVVSGRKPSAPRGRGQLLTHPRKSHKSRMPWVQTKHLRKQIIIAGNSYASCQLCQRLVQAYPSHVETHVLQHLRDENRLQWVAACLMCPPNAQLRTLYRSNLIRIHLTRKHGQQNPQPDVHYLDHTDRYTEMIEQKRLQCFPSRDFSAAKKPNFDSDDNVDHDLLPLSPTTDAIKSEFAVSDDDEDDDDGTVTHSDGTVVLNANGTTAASQLLKLCVKCNRNVVNSPSFRKKHVLTHLLDERKIDWLLSCSLCPTDHQYRSISHEDLVKNHLPMVHGVERALVNVHYVDRTNDYKSLINSTANEYLL